MHRLSRHHDPISILSLMVVVNTLHKTWKLLVATGMVLTHRLLVKPEIFESVLDVVNASPDRWNLRNVLHITKPHLMEDLHQSLPRLHRLPPPIMRQQDPKINHTVVNHPYLEPVPVVACCLSV